MSEVLATAISAHRAGDVDGARTIALAGLAVAPDDATLLHFLGMIEAKSGSLAAAQDLLTRATVASPEFGPALHLHILREHEDCCPTRRINKCAESSPIGQEKSTLRLPLSVQ